MSRFGQKPQQSYNSNSGKQKSAFKRIGYATLTEKTKKSNPDIAADLTGAGISVWARIALPKGMQAMELRNKDKLLITFKEITDKEGNVLDYAVGSISIADE